MKKSKSVVRFSPELVVLIMGAAAMLQVTCSGVSINTVVNGQMSTLCVDSEYFDSQGRLTQGLSSPMLAPLEWQVGQSQAVGLVLMVVGLGSLLIRTRR